MRERYTLYTPKLHRQVRKFLSTHHEFAVLWEGTTEVPGIEVAICKSPKRGPRIDHLKGVWHCNYRWSQGDFRVKYEVLDKSRVVHFYDAVSRGDVYKGKRGATRRSRE